MSADNNELRKVKKYIFEIRNETAALRAFERPGMPDLRAERHAQLDHAA